MTDPHPVPDEDPEQHIGEAVPDPEHWGKEEKEWQPGKSSPPSKTSE